MYDDTPFPPEYAPEEPRNAPRYVDGGDASDGNDGGAAEPVSVHRAFVYAAMAPGFGEWYAGARIRGAAVFTAFVGVFVWGSWELAVTVGALLDLALGATVDKPLPLFQLGAAFFIALALWYWGMAGAVQAAVHRRQAEGDPPQVHPAWGAAMSWLCPGAGQISLGRLPMGFILLGLYVAIFPTLGPALAGLRVVIEHASGNAGQMLSRPDLAMELAQEISARIQLSFPRVAQDMVKSASIALYCATLGPIPGALGAVLAEEGLRWTAALWARCLGLAVLGWICPGAPQLLQGREALGWSLLGLNLALPAVAGLLMAQGLVQPPVASHIASWATLAVLASIADSLIRMIRLRRQPAYPSDFE